MGKFWRAAKLRSALLAAAASAALVAPAYAQQQAQTFNIPAQNTASALNEFARQAGVQILFPYDVAQRSNSEALQGSFTRNEALRRLTAGTQLTIRSDDGRTIVLADSASPTQLGAADYDSGAEEEIVVTGTSTRGVGRDVAPVTVLDRDYIDSTGVSSAADLIQGLPQNFSQANRSAVAVPGSNDGGTQGSAVNLRGIGEGATLVLVNGRRMALGFDGSAPDISAIPLSAIERVEVLTDGASAIYGADAVGGVVNFILRRDFDGAETRVYGGAADGYAEWSASQTFGQTWSTGNLIASADFFHRDLLSAADRDFVPASVAVGSLTPEEDVSSFFLAANQEITPFAEVFIEALHTQRDSTNRAVPTFVGDVDAASALDNPQTMVTAGVRADIGGDWRLEASGALATNETTFRLTGGSYADPFFGGAYIVNGDYDTTAWQIKLDGTLLRLPGGDLAAAFGVDWRNESYAFDAGTATNVLFVEGENEQDVQSMFAELRIPLIGPANSTLGIERFDVMLAGRYDEYSNFGSSFNPGIGGRLLFGNGLAFRANYGTSYRAPRVKEYNFGLNAGLALYQPDPGGGPTIHVLEILGVDVDGLEPQTSDNLSIGLSFQPDSIQGLRIDLNYFSIDYTDRISDLPDRLTMLQNEQFFQDLIVFDPTIAQVQDAIAIGNLGQGFFPYDPDFNPDPAFDPASIDVIIDRRRRNLSETNTSGLDASISHEWELGEVQLVGDVQATYIFEREERVTSQSPSFDTVGTLFNPPQLRVRGHLGWTRGPWTLDSFVNFVGESEDVRVDPAASIDSYVTTDARWAYESSAGGWVIALSAQNLFDQDPPAVSVVDPVVDLGFDPTNANPIGRLISLQVTRTW